LFIRLQLFHGQVPWLEVSMPFLLLSYFFSISCQPFPCILLSNSTWLNCAVLGCLKHLFPLNCNHEAFLGCASCVHALSRAILLNSHSTPDPLKKN
jgi:hypothetical protein